MQKKEKYIWKLPPWINKRKGYDDDDDDDDEMVKLNLRQELRGGVGKERGFMKKRLRVKREKQCTY